MSAPVPAPVVAPVLYVDTRGDVWRSAGLDGRGNERLLCDFPQDPDDRGVGESFAWTRAAVESWFGPLVRHELRRAVEPSALILADGTRLVPAAYDPAGDE